MQAEGNVPKTAHEPNPDSPSFLVVGIGASAGGLEALERFFRNVSPDSGMAYVVVQHLSPDFKSLMPELLARQTPIPIHVVDDGMEVKPNTIYLLPPKQEMILSEGKLLLTEKDPHDELTLPIDHFFRSLAQDVGKRAVGIVLSGTGSDGSRGIRNIHDSGGLVICQDELSAKFDGMPRSARDTGIVDLTLAPEEIPDTLVHYSRHPTLEKALQTTDISFDTEGNMNAIFRLLRNQYGIDFSHYKPSMITRRIERRLLLSRTSDVEAYAKQIADEPDELDALYKDLLIGVTRFFRDPAAYERLEKHVLPMLMSEISSGEEFRVWVAATATGEEAYSLAILLDEQVRACQRNITVKIFATDVHHESLDFASAGVYQKESLGELSDARVERYFERKDDGYHVAPELRKMIVFAPHNVIKDAPFTKLNLVTCRNLFIYLKPPVQKKVLSLFHFGLKVGGVLWLGPSETCADVADEFDVLDDRWRVYRKRRDARLAAMHLPMTLPASQSRPKAAIPVADRGIPISQLIDTYDQLLDEFMPPGLLITEDRELAHSFGGSTKYLRHKEGRPSNDVLDMVDAELRVALASALHRVVRDHSPVVFAGVKYQNGSEAQELRLTVKPFYNRRAHRTDMLALIEPQEPRANVEDVDEVDFGELSQEQIKSLEEELHYTKESLHTTIQELQTANEELQSTNEELIASNEELQSTNEELHSVNEELYTVNAEHQRKITELTELTADMDNLLNSTNVHTIFLDRKLRIRKFTPGVARKFNLMPQDEGRCIDGFRHTILDDDLIDEIRRVVDSGNSFEREVEDQQQNWYLLRILPYVARGRVDGAVLTLIDVTSLKQAEAKLEELSEIVEHSDDAIFRIDLDGTIRTWNKGAVRLYGYDSADVVGSNISRLDPTMDGGAITSILQSVAEDVHLEHLETKCIRADQSTIDVSLTLSPIRGDGPNIVGASAIARDITERKQAEVEVREAVRRRDEFLATLSHELRNPLGAVLNAIEAARLNENASVDSLRHAHKVVERQGKHMARLLDDLLDVSRITQNKIEFRKEVVDLVESVEDVAQCVSHLIDKKNQKLFVEASGAPARVYGDPARLKQVQVNLLTNASKYTPNGGCIWYELDVEGDEAIIRVRDSGEGIPQEMLVGIFDLFVQTGSDLDRSLGGMGVGLSLARSIVEAHEGTIIAFSEGRGKGSQFTVRLPLTNEHVKQRRDYADVTFDGCKLLLVEDNDDARNMLAQMLRLNGFDVAEAASGDQAIKAFEQFDPDISVIDIGLPDIDGCEVARAVRDSPNGSDALLVALTGYGRDNDRRATSEAGFDTHLVKPLTPADLYLAVAEHLAEKAS